MYVNFEINGDRKINIALMILKVWVILQFEKNIISHFFFTLVWEIYSFDHICCAYNEIENQF